jgi:hypothetical protein
MGWRKRFASALSSHDQPLWLRDLASLSLLCGGGITQDTGGPGVYGEQMRALCEHVVLAEYRCRDDWQNRHVKEVRDGVFDATPFASPQGSLIPVTAQESLVRYRPNPRVRQARLPFPAEQWWLFELVHTASRHTGAAYSRVISALV